MNDAFSYQCWICPICFDDHSQDKDCKVSDLKEQIAALKSEIADYRELLGFIEDDCIEAYYRDKATEYLSRHPSRTEEK